MKGNRQLLMQELVCVTSHLCVGFPSKISLFDSNIKSEISLLWFIVVSAASGASD
jgi:hypothetical protein